MTVVCFVFKRTLKGHHQGLLNILYKITGNDSRQQLIRNLQHEITVLNSTQIPAARSWEEVVKLNLKFDGRKLQGKINLRARA